MTLSHWGILPATPWHTYYYYLTSSGEWHAGAVVVDGNAVPTAAYYYCETVVDDHWSPFAVCAASAVVHVLLPGTLKLLLL